MQGQMEISRDIYSNMQTGSPYKSYIKTVLGKVRIMYLDPFTGQPVATMLTGNPKKLDETSILDIWDEKQDLFFKRQNRFHLEKGHIITFERPQAERPKTFEESTDEELKEFLKNKFMIIQKKVNTIDSVVLLTRLVDLAKEMDLTQKIVSYLETKLSALQAEEFSSREE
jgi:hypothetical protein